MSVTAYIGFGSNQDDPAARLAAAIARIEGLGTTGYRLQPWETQPVGPEQPSYLNSVMQLETTLPAAELLEALLAIERDMGRDRAAETERWGPRRIDLDLLLYGDEIIDTPGLQVPHPRMTERSFVLVPLARLAPDLRHPVTGRRIVDHLADLRASAATWTWVRPYRPEISGLPETELCGRHELGARNARSITWRRNRWLIGLVPTMGFLHEGHLSLMRQARAECDVVVVSIFVNPLQFGPDEDLDEYPRDTERDVEMCRSVGVDLVFTTTAEEMYPDGFATYVDVEGLGEALCGASRPGHFRGVTTVVSKLFNIVGPDHAYFGRKDAQQAAILRRMTTDLDFPIDIRVLPIVREPDGLALSSRNAYLSPDERARALGLIGGLRRAKQSFDDGERDAERLKQQVAETVAPDGDVVRVDYIEVVSPETFGPVPTAGPGDLVALAVFVGRTRLIDNMVLGEDP